MFPAAEHLGGGRDSGIRTRQTFRTFPLVLVRYLVLTFARNHSMLAAPPELHLRSALGAPHAAVGRTRRESHRMKAIHLKTPALMCNSCTTIVERALSGVVGVIGVTANFERGTTSVMYDETRAEPEVILSAVTAVGFEVERE